MNEYEARQEEKRRRLQEAAERAEAEADRRLSEGSRMVRDLNGQPILIGHHSEKRHRAYLKRADNHMRKGSEAHEKAQELRGRAAAVGTGGISSDDPGARTKLEEKIKALEAKRERMKAVNKAYRKGGFRECERLGLIPEGSGDRLKAQMPEYENKPFPTWSLSNLSARIRQTKKRLEELGAAAEDPAREEISFSAPDERGGQITITDDQEENRICFRMERKPSDRSVSQIMRRWGFKWNRRLTAWTRFRNNGGWHAAEMAAKEVAQ